MTVHCTCAECHRFRLKAIEQDAAIEELRGELRQLRQQIAVVRGRVSGVEVVA